MNEEDILFRRLPAGRGFMSGTGRNASATSLHDKILFSHELAMEVKGLLEFLDWTEFVTSEREVADVGAASGMVTAKSRGREGAPLRTAVIGYAEANNELPQQVYAVKAAKDSIDAASMGVTKVVAELALKSARREESAAAANLSAHEAEMEKRKKWAVKIIDGVVDLAFDPSKIKDVVKDLVKFAGAELLVEPLVEAAYSRESLELAAALRQARARVLSLEDTVHVADVERATKTLSAAQAMYSKELFGLKGAVRKAEVEYENINSELMGMGGAGEKAAAAIDARALAAKQGAAALEKLRSYESALASIHAAATSLRVGYVNYASMASSPGGRMYVADDDRRTELWSIADHNASISGKIVLWSNAELAMTASALQYVYGMSYLRKYDEIDDILLRAINDR